MRQKLLAGVMVLPALGLASGLKPIDLPPAQTSGGKPLMQALEERKTSREFSTTKLPVQILSNLLWAAFGVNRPNGHRTAPSAMNHQEIDIYVATADGLYLYQPDGQRLTAILSDDLRAATGTQDFAGTAPVDLVYVADFAKMGGIPLDDKIFYSAADAGFIGQNVYLYCASEGLATVVRGSIHRAALAKAMRLRADQRIILAQTVGYPQ